MNKPSLRFEFNKQDLIAYGNNALWFTAPIIFIYTTSVMNIIQQPGHIISLKDFIPNNVTIIGIVYYFLNRITDFVRRYVRGKAE